MSQTIASALDNRVVTFVNIGNVFNCAICMQVADDATRCSCFCAGIFCNKCINQALTRKKKCPSCNKDKITASIDVLVRNQIMEHAVFCTNKAVDPDVNDANTDRKRKASSNEKCTWTSKYDDLRAHLNVCEYEVVDCSNDGCADKVERREMDTHQQVCVHRMTHCDHCNANVKATAMNNHLQQCPSLHVTCECKLKCTRQSIAGHREKDCPLTEIQCEVIGCNVKVMRKNYEKHEKQAAQQHVRLLSHTLQTLANLVESKPIQVIWRITGIAAKLQEAAIQKKKYQSPRFDTFLGGDHKLFISANIVGNKLGLYLKCQLIIVL